ncbi:MAG: hypothetical protein MN733_11850, partial [Nitrososphaera sp.]|nr:hypothetical protein [Nitrososphaera sp.]
MTRYSTQILSQEPKYSKDPVLQRKVENVLSGVPWTGKNLYNQLHHDNKVVVLEFLTELARENLRPATMLAYITTLVQLSRYYNHRTNYREFTKDAVQTFLDSFKKA